MESSAASITAFSTQPPLTEPENCPSEVTTIFDPTRRGAEPHVWTTVASANCFPSARQRSISGRISRILPLVCLACFYSSPHLIIELLGKFLRDRQHQACRKTCQLS